MKPRRTKAVRELEARAEKACNVACYRRQIDVFDLSKLTLEAQRLCALGLTDGEVNEGMKRFVDALVASYGVDFPSCTFETDTVSP